MLVIVCHHMSLSLIVPLLRQVLSDSSNPACHLLNRLAALYHESYSGLGTSPFLLPHAINEAKEMIRQIHALIR